MSTYYVPDTIQGIGNTVVSKTDIRALVELMV